MYMETESKYMPKQNSQFKGGGGEMINDSTYSPVKLWEKMTQPQENCNINFDYGFGKLNTCSFK